jgi:hypothetical protein
MEIPSSGGMFLDDYVIGKIDKQNDIEVEYGGFVPIRMSTLAPKENPLAPKCHGKWASISMGKKECFGCTFLSNGLCLYEKNEKQNVNVYSFSYSRLGKFILNDLYLQIINGKEWNCLADYIRTKYAGVDLEDAKPDLQRWLKHAGLFGFLFIDTELFESCHQVRQLTANAVFSSPYILIKPQCDSCVHRFENRCSMLNAKLFSHGDSIDKGVVKNQIDAMVRMQKVSCEVGNRCKKIADVDPIRGLKIAVNSMQSVNEPLAVLSLDAPEPADASAVKDLLKSDEMVVEVDPATEFNGLNINEKGDGAGIDEFLG